MSDNVKKNAIFAESIRWELDTEQRLAKNTIPKFHMNPFNPGNHQFVTGKIFHQGPESQANENYLQDVQRVQEQPATARFSSPQTSSQEIGWFTKYVPSTGYDSQETVKKPIVHSELSQYMSTYWKYYPSNNNLLRGASNPKTVAQNK